MITNVYSIWDTVALEYIYLYTANNDGLASRIFASFLRSGQSVAKPSELSLDMVGTFDLETGNLVGCDTRTVVRGDVIVAQDKDSV